MPFSPGRRPLPALSLLALTALVCVSRGAVVLDGTGLGTGVIQTSSSVYGVTFGGSKSTAGGGTILNSGRRYGFTLTTTRNYTLFRLDLALNANSGGPYGECRNADVLPDCLFTLALRASAVVDFLLEVWAATPPRAVASSPLFSAHAMGTVPANNVKGFASLVLPGTLTLAAGGTYAVTFSPQTPSNGFIGWGFPLPTGGTGVTVLSDCYSSDAGATWAGLASASTYFGVRLLDTAGATFTGLQTWTDQTSGGNVMCTSSCSFWPLAQVSASSILHIGLTMPYVGTQTLFGLSSVSFSVCAWGGAIAANTLFFTVSLYTAAVSNAGFVSPLSVIATVAAAAVPAIASSAGVSASATLFPPTWALAYTPASPYFFIGVNFSGSTSNAYLCPWTDSTQNYWRPDTWSITGVGGEWPLLTRIVFEAAVHPSLPCLALSFGSSWSPEDFMYDNAYFLFGSGTPTMLNGIKVRRSNRHPAIYVNLPC